MSYSICKLVRHSAPLPLKEIQIHHRWRLANHQQRRFLDLQEYQSKQLLHEHGVNVQRFKVASTSQEVAQIVMPEHHGVLKADSRWSGFKEDISKTKEFVIKAQILAGGRGMGSFVGSGMAGGVQLTKDREDAIEIGQSMLNDHLVTKQTSKKGVLVDRVMIAEAVRLKKEFYFAIVLDRSYDKGPILVCSPYGGMDIEEAAEKDETAIRKFTIPLDVELTQDLAKRIAVTAFDLNLDRQDIISELSLQIMRLYSLFLKLDATQIEINPLGITSDYKIMCVDAKIKFDENARFRQKWLDEVEILNQKETDQREFEANKHNLNFIGLDGSIGCLVNGAGLAMATMDIIKLHGGDPANFLDVGGSATATQVREAFRIISSDYNVRAILVNIFGGIMRCDVIAEGIIQAAQTLDLKTPIVCRLQGNRVEDAQALIRASKMKIHARDDLDDAVQLAVRMSR